MVLALTLRSFTSTLLPQRTIGICSQTRTRSPTGIREVLRFACWALTVPVGNVLVRDSGGDIKQDDTALAIDVVPVS